MSVSSIYVPNKPSATCLPLSNWPLTPCFPCVMSSRPQTEEDHAGLELRPRSCLAASGQTWCFLNQKYICNFSRTHTSHTHTQKKNRIGSCAFPFQQFTLQSTPYIHMLNFWNGSKSALNSQLCSTDENWVKGKILPSVKERIKTLTLFGLC